MKLMIDGYLSGNGIGRCPHIKGVKVNSIIGPALIGKDPTQQTAIVNFMVYGLIKTCAIKRVEPVVCLLCAKLRPLSMAFISTKQR
ncbi:hypothetical protein YC2023_067110 [Brassica napus]